MLRIRRLLFFTLLLAGVAVGWRYRAPILDFYRAQGWASGSPPPEARPNPAFGKKLIGKS